MTSSSTSALVSEIGEGLCVALRDTLTEIEPERVIVAPPIREGGDDPIKFRIVDASGTPVAFASCSVPASPGLVAKGMDLARKAKASLGSELGRVVLDPIAEGTIGELTYTVLPMCRPLANSRLRWRRQRWQLSPRVVHWLTLASTATCREPTALELEDGIVTPLQQLATATAMPASLRMEADMALERLQRSEWAPRFVLMHGDLWKGNLLIDPRALRAGRPWTESFVIIDWGGAALQGHAIFDLVRLADSFSFRPRFFQRALEQQCRVFRYSRHDARAALTASLAYLAANLGFFDQRRFVEMAERCLAWLQPGSVGAPKRSARRRPQP